MLNKSIPTKFDENDLERLSYFAKLYDRSVSYLIREATRTYLDIQAKKLEFLQEAKMADERYRATGRHINHGAVKGWLKDLASGQASERPKCQE